MTEDHSTGVREAVEYGRRRDHLADRVTHARQNWHDAKVRADAARFEYERALRAETMAELAHRAAVANYEAFK